MGQMFDNWVVMNWRWFVCSFLKWRGLNSEGPIRLGPLSSRLSYLQEPGTRPLFHNDAEFSRLSHATDVAFFETGPGSFISGGMFESNDNVGEMIPRGNLLVNICYGFPKNRVRGETYWCYASHACLFCITPARLQPRIGCAKGRTRRGTQWRMAKNTNVHSPFPKPII